jgi:hypothetical protein
LGSHKSVIPPFFSLSSAITGFPSACCSHFLSSII